MCGADGGVRTPDLMITNHLLCQLSYTSICPCPHLTGTQPSFTTQMVGWSLPCSFRPRYEAHIAVAGSRPIHPMSPSPESNRRIPMGTYGGGCRRLLYFFSEISGKGSRPHSRPTLFGHISSLYRPFHYYHPQLHYPGCPQQQSVPLKRFGNPEILEAHTFLMHTCSKLSSLCSLF